MLLASWSTQTIQAGVSGGPAATVEAGRSEHPGNACLHVLTPICQDQLLKKWLKFSLDFPPGEQGS